MTNFWTARESTTDMKSHLEFRLFWPLATVSLLLLGLGVFGAWHVHELQRRVSAVLSVNVASIRAGEELEIAIRRIRHHLNQFLITQDPKWLENVLDLQLEADEWMAAARRFARTPEEVSFIDEMEAGYKSFTGELDALRPFSANSDREIVNQLAQGVLSNQILEHAQEFLDVNEQELHRSAEENDRLASRLALGLLLLGLCGATAGGGVGYLMARAVRRSIVELSVPIRDVQGKLNEVVGPFSVPTNAGIDGLEAVLRTISERVTMVVEELQQTQQDALRSEQLAAVGQLAAGLAHELRNPLMAIKLLVQSACEQGAEAQLVGRDLSVIEEEILRLEQLVQMFLDFARPPQPQKHTIDLCSTVERVIRLLEPRAAAREVSLTLHAADEPVRVEADEAQIRQVLLNLILNSLDAVSSGGRIALRVESHAKPHVGRWAVIRVIDNGCGLPMQLGNRIFDPFVSTKETGIGLGLSICRRIMETHNGGITAAGTPDGGTVFTVRLPIEVFSDDKHSSQSGGNGEFTSQTAPRIIHAGELLIAKGDGCQNC